VTPEVIAEATPGALERKIKNVEGRKKSTRGADTRARINQATLQIIKRDGMRGVRHRAVAKEAGVPLGATTYHFKDIEDLIVSAFAYWRTQGGGEGVANPYVSQILKFLEQVLHTLRYTK